MNTRPRHSKVNKPIVPAKPTCLQPPTPEEIGQRAHKIFLARGGTHGRDLEDWLLAEQELKCERAGAGPQAAGPHPQQRP